MSESTSQVLEPPPDESTRRLEQRLRRAETLVRIASQVNYERPLPEVLESLAQDIVNETGAVAASAVLLDAQDFSAIAYGSVNLPPGYGDAMIRARQVAGTGDQLRDAVLANQTWVIPDARSYLSAQPEYAGMLDILRQIPYDTLVATPFTIRDGVYGVVYLYYPDGVEVDSEEAAFARNVAARTAPAMDNALLFSETQRRAAELEALHRADEALHRSLLLDDVIEAMAELSVELLGADSSLVATWDENDELAVKTSRGIRPRLLQQIDRTYRTFTHERFADAKPLETSIVEDISQVPVLVQRIGAAAVGAMAEVGIVLDGEFWGVFSIGWRRPRKFSAGDRRLLAAFASRASLAIQNAILFERAQEAASTEERQRLARDLHDSVSQALYGIGLGARTARKRLAQAPPEHLEPIDYIIQLAESGLAETRALIFELVPESLAEQGLALALQRLGALSQARHNLSVTVALCDEPVMPVKTKEALYRIAQESLNNIAKHAQATSVALALTASDDAVTLSVRDDGRGFDTSGEFPGHFGLRSMEERAARAGAAFAIQSQPGLGTSVSVTVPVANA